MASERARGTACLSKAVLLLGPDILVFLNSVEQLLVPVAGVTRSVARFAT